MIKEYKNQLQAIINTKGVIDIDTVKGCPFGIKNNPKGCYGLCYAKKIADFYKLNFTEATKRHIFSNSQLKRIIKTIKYSNLPFIRIGTMGDPCHAWDYTISVCNFIKGLKPIVIITKHWIELTDKQMQKLGEYKVIINTSISPLDTKEQIEYRLKQYNRYKIYGTSILRIVSCEFNKDDPIGKEYAEIQRKLFENENIIDNPLRLNKKYPLYIQGIIKARKVWDMNAYSFMSKFNDNTYVGKCDKCPELCGIIYQKK